MRCPKCGRFVAVTEIRHTGNKYWQRQYGRSSLVEDCYEVGKCARDGEVTRAIILWVGPKEEEAARRAKEEATT